MLVKNTALTTFRANNDLMELVRQNPDLVSQLSDSEIEAISKKAASDKFQRQSRPITTVGTAIPYVDSVVTGMSRKGSFGDKATAGLSTAAFWALFIGISKLYTKFVYGVINRSDTLRNYNQEHPTPVALFTTLTGAAFSALGAVFGLKGLTGGYNRLRKAFNKDALTEKDVARAIDKLPLTEKINTRVLEPVRVGVTDFFAKHATTSKAVKLAIPLALLGLIVKFFYDMSQVGNNAAKNELALRKARDNSMMV